MKHIASNMTHESIRVKVDLTPSLLKHKLQTLLYFCTSSQIVINFSLSLWFFSLSFHTFVSKLASSRLEMWKKTKLPRFIS